MKGKQISLIMYMTKTYVVAGHNEIAMLKADLRKADSEICYVDDQNKRHQQAQKQLTKALEYEMTRTKE